MFERAVELDPNFALAFAELSYAHSWMYFMEYDHTEARLAKAKDAVDKAFELQPDLPEAHLALGYYHYRFHKAYELALKELAIAERGLPNDTRILEAVAFIWLRQGKLEESVENLKKVFERDPRDAQKAFQLANTYQMLRRYPEAERYYDRAIFLEPDQISPYIYKVWLYWLWGSLEKARATLEEMPKKMDPLSTYWWFTQNLLERNYRVALDLLSSTPVEIFKYQGLFTPKAQLQGLIYHLMNEPNKARISFNTARSLLEKEVKERPNDASIHSSLGIVYAYLGRKEEAIREGKLAVELSPVSEDHFIGPDRVKDLACIYTIVGDSEAALDLIEYLLSIPTSFLSVQQLRLQSSWDSLRNNPRFQALLAKYSTY